MCVMLPARPYVGCVSRAPEQSTYCTWAIFSVRCYLQEARLFFQRCQADPRPTCLS